VSLRLLVMVLTVAACGDREPREIARPSPLETGIARDLVARLGTPVTAHCAVIAGNPIRCEAVLVDGTRLPIAIVPEKRTWAWHVDGVVVESKALVDHVSGVLADLRSSQSVDCGARIQVVKPGDRIACKLGGGGLAFVRVAADGATSLELALDAAAAAARGELVTPERDVELSKISKGLEALEGESDGEEAVPGDGGVVNP
jgi:hypothetical protein